MNFAIDVPITVLQEDDRPPSQQVAALLKQLQSMLTDLIQTGEPSSVDIRSLPLMASDYQFLKKLLGEGEVRAEVNVLGVTRIKETGIAGLWWVTHYNTHDEVIAEFIEVTEVPVLLTTQHLALQEGLEKLEQNLLEKAVIKSNGG